MRESPNIAHPDTLGHRTFPVTREMARRQRQMAKVADRKARRLIGAENARVGILSPKDYALEKMVLAGSFKLSDVELWLAQGGMGLAVTKTDAEKLIQALKAQGRVSFHRGGQKWQLHDPV